MRILVVIQARSGSRRLPGKVFLPLGGEPLLIRMLERVRAAKTPFDMVVATTTDTLDDEVEALVTRRGYDCLRGHPLDLLDRHHTASTTRGADAIVKIPSDCPLIDPSVIDRVLGHFSKNSDHFDFVSNLHPATYPDGNDVEVMHSSVLEIAWREAQRPHEREHTTPFIWDQPTRFRIGNVRWPGGRDLSRSHRFTIDYAEDYAFIREVYEQLLPLKGPLFSLDDILELLRQAPDLLTINARYAGVNWYGHHLEVLRTVSPTETRRLAP